MLGKFRLSVTSDANPTATGNNNWIQLAPTSATALLSNPVNVLAGNVLSASDVNASFDDITVTSTVLGVPNITGFRLEAIQDFATGTYPGPGIPGNNNFVLTHFQVSAVPVPELASGILLAIAAAGLGLVKLRRMA